MACEIYWFSGSPAAWRVLLALEVKGVAYESRLLQASEGEHKSPWYLEMNPRGKVPVLKDGGAVISESLAILAYLEAKYPEPPIFGAVPEETARVWQGVFDVENYFVKAADGVFRPILFGGLDEKIAEVKEAAKWVHEELAGFEEALAGSDFLAGAGISATDMALYPVLQLLLRAMGKDEAAPLELGFLPLEKKHPNIAAWARRIEALPEYDKTYPPHWRGV